MRERKRESGSKMLKKPLKQYFHKYFFRVSRKLSSKMTDQSNYESMSDSDGERKFRSVDEIDGKSVHVERRLQSKTVSRSAKTSRNF